ncbi:MAG: DUF1127 domain-containing protein [Gammaproteobacteria bacterium]|nr:DUF1127 domain-containing protein [Gammaproteobacteria bacterium]MDX2459678.1 DUF1127 domain-containing protein [Gammaproteobacteria bacterium]
MSNHNYAHAGTGPGIGFAEAVTALSRHYFGRLGSAYDRYRQRRVLLELDNARLDDIGVTPVEAFAEGKKPVWR